MVPSFRSADKKKGQPIYPFLSANTRCRPEKQLSEDRHLSSFHKFTICAREGKEEKTAKKRKKGPGEDCDWKGKNMKRLTWKRVGGGTLTSFTQHAEKWWM